MISTEAIEPNYGIDKDDESQDRYSNDDIDEEDDDDNTTLSIKVMHEDSKRICKLGDKDIHEKSFNVSKDYNTNTYLYQKQTNLRLHDSRLGGISCLNRDKDETNYHQYYIKRRRNDTSLETNNKAISQKVKTKETKLCFKAISSLDKFKESYPFHINKKQTAYQKQKKKHNNETVKTSNLKTRHCIISNSISVYLIELLVVSIFVTIINDDHSKLVPIKYVSALDEVPLPLIPIEKALVPLVLASSSIKSDSLNESSLIWPIISGNSSVQLPSTSQQQRTTASSSSSSSSAAKAVIEGPIQEASDDDEASKQRSLHLLEIQFVESLASLSSLLQAASRADNIAQPRVITAPNHGTIGVESVESVVKVPTIPAATTSQTYLEQPSEIMEDYSGEQELQAQDSASDTTNSLPSKTFQLFSFAGFGGGSGNSIGSGVGLGSNGGSKRRDLQMQTKAINPRGLLSLDSSNNLILPQMHQIKSRFNQGCVGGTKCQFFAFCWMSGGSLGASCGLLMTCCVTPSKTEIQPVFYGPVINDPYCGRSTSKISRIVGGTDASFGQFPWQAFVQVGGSRCGGALISSRHVVTAGHCVARSQHSPSSIKVTLGDYILNSDIESLPHEVFSVVEVLLHPNFRFTPQADRYDVAVLELDRVAQYKDNIKPICLPQKDSSFVGRVAYVAGWGALQAGSKLRPKVLQHVAVPVIENNVCESWHRRKGIDIRIYDEMMCAGYEMGQRDACQGDSGGPLMLNQFGVWYLVGIVSAGYSCAKQYQPGIYHRVSSSSDWISSNLDRI